MVSTIYVVLGANSRQNGADLRSAFEKVFFKQAENALRLCFNASSNGNESCNIMVTSKARKSCHYSKSESFDFRLASAVCQKNAGENYLQIANEAVGLSPGKVRSSVCQRRENVFEKRQVQSSNLEEKRKRLHLSQCRHESALQTEVREGITYPSSVSLQPISDTDIQQIPVATFLPSAQLPSTDKIVHSEVCVFDLERTSLSDACELVQISAVTLDREQSLNILRTNIS